MLLAMFGVAVGKILVPHLIITVVVVFLVAIINIVTILNHPNQRVASLGVAVRVSVEFIVPVEVFIGVVCRVVVLGWPVLASL